MKLDALLKEFGETLTAPIPDFEALLAESKHRKQRRWTAALAGLAGAACVAAILLIPERKQVEAPVVVAVAPVAPSAPVAGETVAAETVTRAAEIKTQRTGRRSTPVRVEYGFVEIAQTRLLPQPQTYQILRVNVSGERLMALGVLRPNQVMLPRMEADVLLGDDGMARAVRVVGNEY